MNLFPCTSQLVNMKEPRYLRRVLKRAGVLYDNGTRGYFDGRTVNHLRFGVKNSELTWSDVMETCGHLEMLSGNECLEHRK